MQMDGPYNESDIIEPMLVHAASRKRRLDDSGAGAGAGGAGLATGAIAHTSDAASLLPRQARQALDVAPQHVTTPGAARTQDPLHDAIAAARPWRTLALDSEYIPLLGGTYRDGDSGQDRRFAPTPDSVLAIAAPMGRGKSTMVREFMKMTLVGNAPHGVDVEWRPKGRFLLLTANQTYAASCRREQQELAREIDATRVVFVNVLATVDGVRDDRGAVVQGSRVRVSLQTRRLVVRLGMYLETQQPARAGDGDAPPGRPSRPRAGEPRATPVDLSECQNALVSFESIHRVQGQQFDWIVLDEVGSLARLVGGPTMGFCLSPVKILRELCARENTRVLALDADLLLDMRPRACSGGLVHDFFSLVMPHRHVVCARLTAAGPSHLERELLQVHTHPKESGRDRWMRALHAHAVQWTLAGEADRRLAIVIVGTISFGRDVCARLGEWKVPFRFYHGRTSRSGRQNDFSDPVAAWKGVCVVVTTTVMGPGIDLPRDVRVSRVFVAFLRNGCSFQQMAQAVLRARHVSDPDVLAFCDWLSPTTRAALVSAGKRNAVQAWEHEWSLGALKKQRHAGLEALRAEARAAGERSAFGYNCPDVLEDSTMRVMAHPHFEQKLQRTDPQSALVRLIQHHGWEHEILAPAETTAAPDVSAIANNEMDEDTRFDVKVSSRDKWAHVFDFIQRKGVAEFFNCCYGWVTVDDATFTTYFGEQGGLLVEYVTKAYFALKHIGTLPSDLRDGFAEIMELWLGDGSDAKNLTPSIGRLVELGLFAKEDVFVREYSRRVFTQPRRLRDAQLTSTFSVMLPRFERLAELLFEPTAEVEEDAATSASTATMAAAEERGNRRLDLHRLVQGAVQVSPAFLARVERVEKGDASEPGDQAMMDTLRAIHREIQGTSHSGYPPKMPCSLLDAILKTIAMKTNRETRRVARREAAGESRRTYTVALRLERILPLAVVDEWLLFSNTANGPVKVSRWDAEHEELQADRLGVRDYGSLPEEDGVDANGVCRTEFIDDAGLQRALRELRAVPNRNASQESRLRFLELLDEKAESGVSNDDGSRALVVTYSRRSSLGRTYASVPSMQSCPSTLRSALVGRWYHDIDIANCHPTLMLQVASKWGDGAQGAPRLRSYVEHRKDMLCQIAKLFGVTLAAAKDGVLRVLNGGSGHAWLQEQLDRQLDESVVDDSPLVDLYAEALRIRDAFFAMIANTYPEGTLEALLEEVRQRRPRTTSNEAIKRSVFALCVQSVEDAILSRVDEHFKANGWSVDSLIFDGMHVRHNENDTRDATTGRWRLLEACMRGAEQLVADKLGYTIELVEKPLFVGSTRRASST